ncbi:GntR family transcriptional regulator [Blastococcus haudaquaticus]|uniref:Transcriptional regulator, GntR family n=1 Tax=Blastococcus haudaquaticus TaxID=1938745 RepID=A0A286GU04_9ACTN|nr:GntR family transcriptional regulator [Blastococcus haudaquaticus]SOD98990.1 transcriptional regulator, GntR family [Blastococcus haudaquaticus]
MTEDVPGRRDAGPSDGGGSATPVRSPVHGLQPVETVALGDRTLDAIRRAIISGELPSGEPLRDRQLAEALGVSRTPVREALHKLEAAGLVQPRGRTGWEVAAFTEQDVHELFQIRRLIEPLGLDQLAKNPDHPAVARLSSFFDGYSHPVEPSVFPSYFRRDNDFHLLIVHCTGNTRLERFYAVLEKQIDRGRHFLSPANGRADETLDEHVAVTRAVADGDFQRARTALLRHLDTGEELMIKHLRSRAAGA